MAWATRPWATAPGEDVMRSTEGGRLLNKQVRLFLDPRAFNTDDANDLRVEGTVLAVSSDGPLLVLEQPGGMLERIALIDILVIEAVEES